jgi:UDP-glucose/GDP-mannose dehydrogenase family, UDP binding domain
MTYCSNLYEAAECADAIVIVTEWDEFRQLDWDRLRSAVERPLVAVVRNMLDATEVARHGFRCISAGRPPMTPEPPLSTANDDHRQFEYRQIPDICGPVF